MESKETETRMYFKAQIHVIPMYGEPYWMGVGFGFTENLPDARATAIRAVGLNENFNIDQIRVLSKPADWVEVTREDVKDEWRHIESSP